MWGFWRPKVRLMLLEDPGVFLGRLIGEADGNAGIKHTTEFVHAHPIVATYATLWDIRTFVGVVSDADLVELFELGKRIRIGMGLPPELMRPRVYLGPTRVDPDNLSDEHPVPDGLLVPLQVTTLREAWEAIAPGMKLPRKVKSFFNAA